MTESSDPKSNINSNPIVDEFLRNSKVLNLNRFDLSNTHNLFCVVNSIEESELSQLKEVFNLEHCKLGYKNIESLYAALSKNISTTFHLCLSWNKLGEKGMVPMRKLFTPTVNMTRLYLDGNSIGNMGMHSLMRAMEVSRARITHLSLDLNHIGTAGMLSLADRFPVALGSIRWLSLSENDMSGEDVAKKVAKSLKFSRTLTSLNLSSTRLGSEGASAIAYHLVGKNTVLKSLDMTHNNIRDVGAHAVSLALQVNNVLTRLRLGSNNIGPTGCGSFVIGMNQNETLLELDLSRTHHSQVALGVDGARQLSQMLSVNRSLTHLNLYWCDVRSEGAMLLASALEDNKTITKINLGGNYIGPEAVRRLETCMSPMYQPNTDGLTMSAWDSKVPSTPFLLNRRAQLAARRPQSAAPALPSQTRHTMVPTPTVLGSVGKPKNRETAININSRKSVLIKSNFIVRKPQPKREKPTGDKLFAVSLPPPRESRAILPEIRNTLMSIDLIVGSEIAEDKACSLKLLQHGDKVSRGGREGELSSAAEGINGRPLSPIGLLFQV